MMELEQLKALLRAYDEGFTIPRSEVEAVVRSLEALLKDVPDDADVLMKAWSIGGRVHLLQEDWRRLVRRLSTGRLALAAFARTEEALLRAEQAFAVENRRHVETARALSDALKEIERLRKEQEADG